MFSIIGELPKNLSGLWMNTREERGQMDCQLWDNLTNTLVQSTKALHSKLLTKLSSRFSSRNEFFVIFGKFRISKFPKFRNFRTFGKTSFRNFWTFSEISKLFPNFFPNFSELFDQKTGFFDRKPQILHNFFQNFQIWRKIRLIFEVISEL